MLPFSGSRKALKITLSSTNVLWAIFKKRSTSFAVEFLTKTEIYSYKHKHNHSNTSKTSFCENLSNTITLSSNFPVEKCMFKVNDKTTRLISACSLLTIRKTEQSELTLFCFFIDNFEHTWLANRYFHYNQHLCI